MERIFVSFRKWGTFCMNENIVIWGTGLWGDIAYYYYKKKSNIACYVDSDQRKWGEVLNGVKIYSPTILKDKKVKVVVAIKNEINTIIKTLEEYDIESYVLFQIKEEVYSRKNINHNSNAMQEDTCIVAFSGGLGNQMFQYALLKNLEIQGKRVMADLKAYSQFGVMDFQLTDVFRNIKLEPCVENQKQELIEKNFHKIGAGKKFVIYSEPFEYGTTKKADMSLLNITGGIICGLHQNYVFPGQIREILLKDFKFSGRENKLKVLHDNIGRKNAVSVHVRRGDYLTENNKWLYGDICTERYYRAAIKYIQKRAGDCILYFFSNDIEWVKKHYNIDNALYIEENMFDSYQDWYDLYLMSICKHNIIANSTFSWWGAWLNQNENKIVVAPKKWINMFEYEDIFPKEWIQI